MNEWYGLRPPKEATRAWGARAIYNPRGKPPLDFLPDRQSYLGEKIPTKVFKGLLRELRRFLTGPNCPVSPVRNAEYVVTLSNEHWVLRFNTQGSDGYLYCVIHETFTR